MQNIKNNVSLYKRETYTCFYYIYMCTWAPAERGKGGHLPPPGISKLSLLLFISVICVTYEGQKGPSPPPK